MNVRDALLPLVGLLTFGCAPLARAQQAAPSAPRLRYEGRFDTSDPAGPRCAWPVSAVTVRFVGRALNVRLGDADTNRYEIIPDSESGFGANWHPSLKTHWIMAGKMAGTLSSDLGWKPARP